MTHKLIHTPDYLLVVDDSEIKFKDRYFNEEDGIGLWQDAIPAYHKLNSKKIIAHLPLNNSPILEGVDLLPPLEDEVEELAKSAFTHPDFGKYKIGSTAYYNGYKEGYNKAKEKYDDVLKWIDDAILLNPYYNDSPRLKEGALMVKVKLQSLSQPKMPVGFECEIEYFYMASRMFYKDADWVKCNKDQYESIREEIPTCPLKKVHKEISTPEGHTRWVGKYIY